MYSIFSKEGSWILTFDDTDDDPAMLTVQEFIDRYGEDCLPARAIYFEDVVQPQAVTPVNELEDTMHYYASLMRLCQACGRYSRVEKQLFNVTFGVPLDELDSPRKYDARRRELKRLESELGHLEINAKACARNFDYWHQRVGFRLLSDVDREFLLKYLYQGDFRKRMYRRIRKYEKAQKLVALNDLISEIFISFIKQNKLPL